MPNQEEAQWAATRRTLESARGHLTNPDDEELQLYTEFLDHNELGLALDALVDVAVEQRAPSDVWVTLSEAARCMNLQSDDETYGSTVDRITERLNAAHEWRGLQRLLNEWDPIGVRPTSGGPDDEYSCLYYPLMTSLERQASPAEIARFLRAELSEHFGIRPDSSKPEAFAERLVEWFTSGAPAQPSKARSLIRQNQPHKLDY